ncbi:sulfotransferase domain-containing protein [Methyloligella solikamskensis]|uniref:Sulfotransferase domain-containing protein n=1 Tax=Methyloligella solikamskensis TaxID=1177756 RepID=A0ABW3JAG3_9HYPH
MWVIANGAPKSGSTWIFQLIRETRSFSPLPKAFQDQDWNNQSVDTALLKDAIEILPAQAENFATKQHWPSPAPLFEKEADSKGLLLGPYRRVKQQFSLAQQARLQGRLLSTPGIKICNIIRDIRDVVVSLYHHQVRLSRFHGDIESFLRCNGDLVIRSTVDYHHYWMHAPRRSPINYFVTAYEYLSEDTPAAAGALFDFLQLELSEETRDHAVEATKFDAKKSTGPGMFFRKGRPFAFDDDLDADQAGWILEAAKRRGLGEVKRAIAEFNPTLGPYLEVTDVGLGRSS